MEYTSGFVRAIIKRYLMQRNYPPQSLFHTLVDGPVGDPAHDPLPISRRALLCNRWPVMRTFFERILQKLVRRGTSSGICFNTLEEIGTPEAAQVVAPSVRL